MTHTAPVINGDGSYSRDFTYIDDCIQANFCAMNAPASVANTVYNVAGGRETSLNELFEYLKAALAGFDPAIKAITPEYGPERPGDIPHSLADISQAQQLLGYTPHYSIKDGLYLTAQWYFEHLR